MKVTLFDFMYDVYTDDDTTNKQHRILANLFVVRRPISNFSKLSNKFRAAES